jgi:hypothetical protein
MVMRDRRFHARVSVEDRTTRLVEAIRLDPVKAARDLRKEMRGEVDLVTTRELLEWAEQVAYLRGVNLRGEVITVWRRITVGLA